jgi:hypothetical protein
MVTANSALMPKAVLGARVVEKNPHRRARPGRALGRAGRHDLCLPPPQGVTWRNKSPLNGRELVAEDIKFTYDRFLTEKGNANRSLLAAVDRMEVVDRYTVKFPLKEPYVWLVNALPIP